MADGPSGGGEKTELPTEKRLRESREKGDVLQSKELGTAMIIIGGTMAFVLFGEMMVGSIAGMLRAALVFDIYQATDFNVGQRTLSLLMPLAIPFGGLFAFLLVACVATPAALGSLGFRWSAIQPKASKMNPMSGLKRMFGTHGLIELVKSLAKVVLMGTIGVVMIMSMLPQMAQLGHGDVRQGIAAFGDLFSMTLLAMAGALGLIALIDVPAQWYQRNQKLMMTKQEVRDEYKDTEGKPEVKGRIRQLQREMAERRMMQAVPQADVVITNPTHFAVALKYDPEKGGAPMLLAKGGDFLALKIREIAQEHQVMVLESPALARAVYYSTELDQEIPAGLYLAVAQVLAYVYQLRQYKAGKGKRPGPLPDLPIPADLRRDS
ncbi:MAG: flagellar biosynthesis protein FlhB [Blastomonas sp.]|nr:flagellar biosynthesis protein FlhB [Blastomonas sp.]